MTEEEDKHDTAPDMGKSSENVKRSYRLISSLGQGGFGTVYRAQLEGTRGFSKTVAIKVLNEDRAGVADFQRRLRDEARMLSMLKHRAIVYVEDLVRIEGRWAVVMEFIEGTDVENLIALGPVPPRSTCEIVAEVASALLVAHEAKDPTSGSPLSMVHRDVKPANIRITPSGEVKVLDFGVARATLTTREARTRSIAFGSDGYLAPERYDRLDTAAGDVYALGAVTFECLSGDELGQLSVNFVQHKVKLKRKLDKLAERLQGPFGAEITGFVNRMMSYDHRDRPETAEVADRFQELMLRAPGQWLKRWAPEALGRVKSREAPLGDRDEPSGESRTGDGLDDPTRPAEHPPSAAPEKASDGAKRGDVVAGRRVAAESTGQFWSDLAAVSATKRVSAQHEAQERQEAAAAPSGPATEAPSPRVIREPVLAQASRRPAAPAGPRQKQAAPAVPARDGAPKVKPAATPRPEGAGKPKRQAARLPPKMVRYPGGKPGAGAAEKRASKATAVIRRPDVEPVKPQGPDKRKTLIIALAAFFGLGLVGGLAAIFWPEPPPPIEEKPAPEPRPPPSMPPVEKKPVKKKKLPTTGRVSVEISDGIGSIYLTDASGTQHGEGMVPAGSYVLHFAMNSGRKISTSAFDVTAGVHVEFRCSEMAQACNRK